ncbi:MAG TPA: hypothetical protein VGB85_24350 [Nannocystis sp.]
MSREPDEEPIFSGYSEFGAALAEFVGAELSAHGAILSDAEGDPIDFAHRHGAVTPLDLQIAGAQVEQAATRMAAWCVRQGLGRCEILIEASHGLLLSAAPGDGCVLTSLHAAPDRGGSRDDPTGPGAASPSRETGPAGEAAASGGAEGREDGLDGLLARFSDLRHRIGGLIQ